MTTQIERDLSHAAGTIQTIESLVENGLGEITFGVSNAEESASDSASKLEEVELHVTALNERLLALMTRQQVQDPVSRRAASGLEEYFRRDFRDRPELLEKAASPWAPARYALFLHWDDVREIYRKVRAEFEREAASQVRSVAVASRGLDLATEVADQ